MTAAPDIDQDTPITLKEACAIHYRDRVKVSSLRAEAARGRLDIFRIGRTDFTTLKLIREMERRCRDADPRRASISTLNGANGQSETERLSSARAALSQTVSLLKGNSPNTSDKSIHRRRGAIR